MSLKGRSFWVWEDFEYSKSETVGVLMGITGLVSTFTWTVLRLGGYDLSVIYLVISITIMAMGCYMMPGLKHDILLQN